MSYEEAQLGDLYERALSANKEPNRQAEVVELLGVYLRQRSEHGLAWLLFGNALHALGRTYDAEKALLRALELAGGNTKPLILAKLGRVHADRGDRVEAEKWFANATSEEPRSGRLWIQRGENLAAMGNLWGAEECHRKAIDLNKADRADAYVQLGVVLRASQRYIAAIAAFKNALELQPSHAEAQKALVGLRQIREAIKLTRQLTGVADGEEAESDPG